MASLGTYAAWSVNKPTFFLLCLNILMAAAMWKATQRIPALRPMPTWVLLFPAPYHFSPMQRWKARVVWRPANHASKERYRGRAVAMMVVTLHRRSSLMVRMFLYQQVKMYLEEIVLPNISK